MHFLLLLALRFWLRGGLPIAGFRDGHFPQAERGTPVLGQEIASACVKSALCVGNCVYMCVRGCEG